MTTERTNWPDGMMLRHSRAARYLPVGSMVYNTPDLRTDGSAPGDETTDTRTRFRKVDDDQWQPCTADGTLVPLAEFPDGFASEQLFMPVYVTSATYPEAATQAIENALSLVRDEVQR